MVNFPLLVLVFSFAALVLSAQIGDFARNRVKRSAEDNRDDSGIVLSGVLTLLGLIIGFSFSMAINRYDLRKSCEQVEANAIAIEYMRTDLVEAGDAAKVHELLKQYLDQRVLFYSTRDRSQLTKNAADTAQLQDELWSAVRSAATRLPPQLQGLVLSSMNDVVTSQLSAQAAWLNRIPIAAWVLMLSPRLAAIF